MKQRNGNINPYLSASTLMVVLSACFFGSRLYAEGRNTNAIAPVDQRIQQWLEKKPTPEDTLYDQLFSPSDNDIKNRFQSISGHENVVGPQTGLLSSSLNNQGNPLQAEMQSRQDFALYVMRLRLNTGVRNSIRLMHVDPKNLGAVKNIQKAQRAIDNIRQQSVTVGNGPEPLIFKFGYDLVTDVTRIWWEKGAMQAGIVHSGLINCMTGKGASFADALVHFSTSLGNAAPRAFIGVPLRGNSLDVGLSHILAGTQTQVRFGSLPASGDIPRHEVVQATVALPFGN